MEPEDFEDYIQDEEREAITEMVRKHEEKFTQGCIEGYKLIEEYGVKCIDLVKDRESAEEALNRMLGYFTQIEHYEKCKRIKEVYVQAFQKEPNPIFPNFLSL